MSVASVSVSLAQTTSDRAQLLEEQQIARMVLEIESSRDLIAKFEKESAAKDQLVAKLDAEIRNLNRMAVLHKSAAADREKALALKDQVEKSYRKSLDEANKRISRLEGQKGFWKKVSGAGVVAGFILGVLVTR